MDQLLVTVAPCIPPYMASAVPGYDFSAAGIAEEVVRAWNAGACIAHLHVCDERGQPTTDLSVFESTVRMIRERCDIIIEGSTGGVNTLTPSERSVSLRADIELASLNLGSVNYAQGVYINSPDDISYWVHEMHSRAIKPDNAVFEAGMIESAKNYIAQGMISSPYLFSFVLGQQGAMPATANHLAFLCGQLPPQSIWTAIGHDGNDLRMGFLAMGMGGHVRAGFEDNPYYRPGELAQSNAQLIERLVRVARELGRQIMSPAAARHLLGIPSADS